MQKSKKTLKLNNLILIILMQVKFKSQTLISYTIIIIFITIII